MLDLSGSMLGQRFEIAKQTVEAILETLSDNDFFNILPFSKAAAFLDECAEQAELLQATMRNKKLLRARLNSMSSEGKGEYEKGLAKAFETLLKMFLYEATSTMIVFGSLNVQLKEQYMKELVGSLLQKFLAANDELCKVSSPEDQQKIRHYMSNIIGYSSRITKAFTSSNSMASCNCIPIFYETMNTYLEKVPTDSTEMMDSLRQYLHRMVACLDEQLLPALPNIFSKFLSSASSHKTLHDFLLLVSQIFARLKSKVLNSGLDIRALFDLLWSVHSSEHDLADEVVARNLCYLNRAYLQMVLSIIANDLLPLVANCGSDFMARLSASLLSFCTCSDTVAQKVAVSTIAKLMWRCFNNNTIAFIDISVWEQSIITVLQVPLAEGHDPADAQCVLVQHEASTCLQVLRMCLPDRFDAVIRNVLPLEIAHKLPEYLNSLKGKELDKKMDELFAQLRSQRSAA